ncbi:MAG: 6-phosphogluconolactonase [Beijerinckiaceae bacterium]|jgi:6-phosphogluconolactonase|nr:6-phosphogluconolactonase [Beijerinckiaceae bacterium]
MSRHPVLHRHADLADASQALADWVATRLRSALERQERATVALPGGSTPVQFLAALAKQDLPWKRITLLPTDERFVPADHPRSNERMMCAALEPALRAGAEWLSFASIEPGLSPEAFAKQLADRVARLLPLDVVVCGMGEDGHIASLFPGEPQARLDPNAPCIVPAFPMGLEPRISLSAMALREAGEAALLFSGKAKRTVFAQALRLGDKPVTLLLTKRRRLHAFISESS